MGFDLNPSSRIVKVAYKSGCRTLKYPNAASAMALINCYTLLHALKALSYIDEKHINSDLHCQYSSIILSC